MMVRGFLRGVLGCRVLFVCAVGLLTVLSLSARGQADSSLFDSLSFMSSPVKSITGHAKPVRTLTDSAMRKSGATAQGGVVFADWDGFGDYEKVPLTLLSQLLILSNFDDGKGPSSMSLARVQDDFRSGDICSDLGKNATCTMRGGFVSFYENTSPIPEPGTLLLVGSGVLASSLPVFRGWSARGLSGKHARVSS